MIIKNICYLYTFFKKQYILATISVTLINSISYITYIHHINKYTISQTRHRCPHVCH